MAIRRPEGSMADRYRIGLATLNYLPRIVYYLHVRDDFTFPECAKGVRKMAYHDKDHRAGSTLYSEVTERIIAEMEARWAFPAMPEPVGVIQA